MNGHFYMLNGLFDGDRVIFLQGNMIGYRYERIKNDLNHFLERQWNPRR